MRSSQDLNLGFCSYQLTEPLELKVEGEKRESHCAHDRLCDHLVTY